MRLSRPSLKVRLLVMLAAVPLIAWFAVKPVRVLEPRLAGVSCVSATVCIDDLTRLEEAAGLYAEGMAFVPDLLGSFKGRPRVIFLRNTGLRRLLRPGRTRGGHRGHAGHGDRPARLGALFRAP